MAYPPPRHHQAVSSPSRVALCRSCVVSLCVRCRSFVVSCRVVSCRKRVVSHDTLSEGGNSGVGGGVVGED